MPDLPDHPALAADVRRIVRLVALLVEHTLPPDWKNHGGQTLVTLEQIGAVLQRSQRVLQKYRHAFPSPQVLGTRGRPDRWDWAEIRPWLQSTFGLCLPRSFPGSESEHDY